MKIMYFLLVLCIFRLLKASIPLLVFITGSKSGGGRGDNSVYHPPCSKSGGYSPYPPGSTPMDTTPCPKSEGDISPRIYVYGKQNLGCVKGETTVWGSGGRSPRKP